MEPITMAVSGGLATANVAKKVAAGGDPSIADFAFIAVVSTGFAGLGALKAQSNPTADSARMGPSAPAAPVVSPTDTKLIHIKGEGVDGTYLTQGPEDVVSDVATVKSDGTLERTVLTQQFVVDARYAHIGNLLDVAAQIRNGELPDLDLILLGLIDVVDLVSLTFLRPYLMQYKVNPHLKAHIQKKTEIQFDDFVENADSEMGTDDTLVSREENIQKLGELKQRTSFKEIKTTQNTEIRTRVMQESQATYLLDASQVPGNKQTLPRVNTGDGTIPATPEYTIPEEIQSQGNPYYPELSTVSVTKLYMNQMPDRIIQSVHPDDLAKLIDSVQAYSETHNATIQSVKTKSNRTDVTKGAQTEHAIFGWKIGRFSGENIEDSVTTSTINPTHHITEQTIEGIDLDSHRELHGAVTPDMVKKLGGTMVREAEYKAPPITTKTVNPGEFRDGLVSYAPFVGGIIHLGAKYDLAGSVTKQDVFWAAMDSVEIAVLIATLGTASPGFAAAKTAAKTGAKQVSKAVAKQGAKTTSKVVAKEIGQETIEAGAKKITAKQTTKTVVEETGEQAAKRVGKASAKEAVEEGTSRVAKKSGKEVSEELTASTAKKKQPKPHGDAPELESPNKTKSGTNVAHKKPEGGAYSDLKADGQHRHHMPSNDASPITTEKGPSIRMEPTDHRKTASYGNSKEARTYRAKQREHIEQGNFKQAQRMDIDDIRSKFGSKYDEKIQEMRDYTDSLKVPKTT
jgi:hypothetical protein